ncbi:ABC transporter permease [Phytohabitans aurantiacus]|uniref:Peptide ABC transporter permease n=1 Tax=Phytohabitans aurantiacus TaxID=3016789 RepID=A0ABQ5R5H7_9ACTN|nr:ABC transporter permease [Phytohabitans aurantiacus]GLI01796.1 peptide ABC transporter permease [Phytohabitans aurantiacus]
MTGTQAPQVARSPARLAWRRLRRDRVAVASAVVLAVIVALSAAAPAVCALLGIDTERHIELLSLDNVGFPEGAFGGMSADHPLGVEPKTGRDLLALLLYGSRTSLLIALGATALSVVLGVAFGLCAGYFRGWVDSVLSRTMDVLLAFPVLLFSIALLVVLGSMGNGNGLRTLVLILVIGFFGFPYVGRLVRGQVIALRQREFVEAARALGASDRRILGTEILPNLVSPILVVATLTIPTRILAEAALSFLGVGIQPPGTSWGQLLGSASHVFTVTPTYMLFPGLTVVVTVLACNLLGDGLRDAFDPKTN